MNRPFSCRPTTTCLAALSFVAAALGAVPAFAWTGVPCSAWCPDDDPTVIAEGYNSSPLTHAEIAPIFWGSYWSATTEITEGQVVGIVQYIINGPYTAGLYQYDEIAPPRLSALTATDTSAVTENFQMSDVVKEINKEIGAGAVPPPSTGTTMLYSVFMPPGTTSDHFPGDIGYNYTGTCDSSCGSAFEGVTYTYAAIFPSGGDVINYSATFSHEMTEALTSNLVVEGCQSNLLQISDVCQCYAVPQSSGIAMEPYWSAQVGACVIPEAYDLLYEYSGTPGEWNAIGTDVRQVAQGEQGLYATMEDDNVYAYSGSGQSWSKIALPAGHYASTFAVGQSDVLALDTTGSQIYRYTSSGGWTAVGTTFQTYSGVSSGWTDIATDMGGNPWQYSTSSDSWSQIGGPGDQFVTGNTFTAAITPTHGGVYLYFGSNWTYANHGANELYVGGNGALAARDPSTADILGMTTSYSWITRSYTLNPWTNIGSPQDQVVLWDSTTPVVGMTMMPGAPWNSEILQDPDAIEGTQGAWSAISPYYNFGTDVEAVRVFGHGPHIYAAVDVVY